MENSIKEAIILAGGLGTRLRSEIGEVPKSLAPVNNQPFLNYLLRYLKKNGITRVVLAVGYKHESIQTIIGNYFEGIEIEYSVEKEPLGTGGALKLALELVKENVVFVCNGDTYFDIDLEILYKYHIEKNSTCTLALKKLLNVERYGNVQLNDGKVVAFQEKQLRDVAIINGGIYCVNKGILIHYPVNTPFSLEKNYLENNPKAKKIYGLEFDSYFMDIGIPEDYQTFQKDMLK